MLSDDYMNLIKPCKIPCLVHLEDLLENNSDLEIRQRKDGQDIFKKPRDPLSKPKPVTQNSNQARSKKNGKKRISHHDITRDSRIIDTDGYVDDTMVCFLPEFCDRIKLEKMPRDPLDLCKNFQLLIPHCDIPDEHE